jgi:acetyl-CoA C-acetyltransferase
MSNHVVIVEAKRTPIGSFQGALRDFSATALGAHCIKAILSSVEQPLPIDEVIMGCVLTAGLGQAPARQATLHAGLPESVSATTLNKVCGSGMRALMMACDMIKAGSGQILLAGGMESMTNAPYLLPKARAGLRMGHGKIVDHMFMDGLEDAYEAGTPMGHYAEKTAEVYGFTRQAQDSFALDSITKATRATQDGYFSQEISPLTVGKEAVVINQDEPVLKARPEKIPHLKPAFKPDGTVTAANASGICDGAAALLLMGEDKAKELGLTIRARIVGYSSFAQAPAWFTTAPVGAIKKLMSQTGWTTESVDAWEINEAFAVVTMATMKDLGLEATRVNRHGGACALGHPIGATGARMVTTLLHIMERYDLKRGVASPCIGGGEATAIAIERF